jgi:hypothetical protein
MKEALEGQQWWEKIRLRTQKYVGEEAPFIGKRNMSM